MNEEYELLIRLLQQMEARQEQQQQTINNLTKFIEEQVNGRLLTIEWLMNNELQMSKFQTECIDKLFSRSNCSKTKVIEWLNNYPKYKLICEKTIADESNDHLEPESTLEGSTPRPEFVNACERLATHTKKIKLLDIGCGSGGVVFDFISQGHFAVGLDGSNINRIRQKGYWDLLPHLHTCDIGAPFRFEHTDGSKLKFDTICIWEVFEHIPEESCNGVLKNIHENLNDNGFLIGSISRLEYSNAETGTVYHVTLHEKEWWKQLFARNGFIMLDSPFEFHEHCRGLGDTYVDVHNYKKNPEAGFHFYAKKDTTQVDTKNT